MFLYFKLAARNYEFSSHYNELFARYYELVSHYYDFSSFLVISRTLFFSWFENVILARLS